MIELSDYDSTTS